MRHLKIKGRLSRRSSWRKATLKSMAADLIKYQRIRTTLAKAKALRSFVEPLITKAKNAPDSVAARRLVFKELTDRDAVSKLFNDIAPLYVDVPGGYTRIMHLGRRRGDGARMAVMELTKRTIPDEDLLGPAEKKSSKTRSGKSKSAPKKPHAAPEVEGTDKKPLSQKKREQKAKEEEKHARDAAKGQGFLKKLRRRGNR